MMNKDNEQQIKNINVNKKNKVSNLFKNKFVLKIILKIIIILIIVLSFFFIRKINNARLNSLQVKFEKNENEYSSLQTQLSGIENILAGYRRINRTSEDNNFDNRSLIYRNLYPDEYLSKITNKITEYFSVDKIEDLTLKAEQSKVSNLNFNITDADDVGHFNSIKDFIQNMKNVSHNNIAINTKKISIDFLSNYEYPVYQIISVFEQKLPGYVVVKNISITPKSDELKYLYYNFRFHNKKIDINVANRFNCLIELEWDVLNEN